MMRVFGRLVVAGHIMAIYIPAATYYAATNGSDSNPGTQLAPFRHLSKAAAAAHQPGDTVIVMDGNYDNEGAVATADGRGSVVTLKYSGTPGNPITFRAQHRGGATLDAANVSANTGPYACNAAWAYFDVSLASYVVIQGFVIQHGCFNGIRANGNAHDITIKWNEIRNIGNWSSDAAALSSTGVYLNSGEYNFTFDGNIFHDIGGGTIANQEHGIYTSASNVTIVNNVFYNQVHGWDIQTAGGTNVVIVNNTFAFPNPTTDGQLMLWDGSNAGSLSNVTIRNNIFQSPSHVAVVTDLRAAISGSCAIDHNVTNVSSVFDGGSPCTVNNNRTSTDPRLVNTSTAPYDFHVQPSSPTIGAGVPMPGVGSAFDGAPRSTGSVSDIGAYQFLSPTIAAIASVANGASLLPTSIAPGQIISIFGLGIGPVTPASLNLDASGMVDTTLAGTRVVFDGVAAPMIYASAAQVNAIAPYTIAGQASTRLEVEFEGARSPGFSLPVVDSAPGIFTVDSTGSGQGAILNQNLSPNSAAHPAVKGSVIVIYATGEGLTDPPGIDGLVTSGVLQKPLLPVSVTIGGQAAEVLYAGSAPGLVSGVLQVNARVPEGIISGNRVPVVLTVGITSSSPSVTLAVL